MQKKPSLRVECDLHEILDEYAPAVKHNTMNMSVLVSVGITLDQENKLWEAERIFVECVERFPTRADSYHHLALVYSRQSRLLAARRYYTLGLTFNPNYSDYFNDFGVLMMQLKNYEAAYFLCVNAIALDKGWKNHRPWFNLANIYMTEACIDNSGAIDETNSAEDTTPFFYFNSKITFDSHRPLRCGRIRDAKTCLRWVLTLQPAHQRAKNFWMILIL